MSLGELVDRLSVVNAEKAMLEQEMALRDMSSLPWKQQEPAEKQEKEPWWEDEEWKTPKASRRSRRVKGNGKAKLLPGKAFPWSK